MTARGLSREVEAILALGLLVVLSPLLMALAAVVAITSQGPVLFRQRRVGQNGQLFEILKFRTMREGAQGPAITATGDQRVTPLGRVLRKAKLDELPELWNVVRGEMALVGPRPEAPQFVTPSDPLWHQILSIPPGITDPITLRLRNEEDLLAAAGANREAFYRRYLVPYKLLGYQEYLQCRTWKRDTLVLWQTVLAVIRPRGKPAPSPDEVIAYVAQHTESNCVIVPRLAREIPSYDQHQSPVLTS